MEVVEELTKKLITENVTTVMPQDEYNRKYNALAQPRKGLNSFNTRKSRSAFKPM